MPEAAFAVSGMSSNKVRIEPTEIKAEGGPIYPRLIVPLHVDLGPTGQPDQGFTTFAVECGLFFGEHRFKVADAAPITNLSTTHPNGSATSVWNLEFPFDLFRIKNIEARRRGDLSLRFDLAFVVGLLARAAVPKDSTGFFITRFEKPTSQIYVEVPQSHWARKIIPELGLHEYFIVEIPTRTEPVAAAWVLIEKAENAFDRWDIKAVFAHCREAGKALDSIVSNHHHGNSFLVQERWARASEKFNYLASLDLHLEEIKAKAKHSPDQVQTAKPDAECLLIFVKALAKYAEELVRLES